MARSCETTIYMPQLWMLYVTALLTALGTLDQCVSKCMCAAVWQTIFRQVPHTSHIHACDDTIETRSQDETHDHGAQGRSTSQLHQPFIFSSSLIKTETEAHRPQFSPMLSQMTFFYDKDSTFLVQIKIVYFCTFNNHDLIIHFTQ